MQECGRVLKLSNRTEEGFHGAESQLLLVSVKID